MFISLNRTLELFAAKQVLCVSLTGELFSFFPLYFNFFISIHLAATKSNHLRGTSLFQCVLRTIISANFILSCPCCQDKLCPLNSFKRLFFVSSLPSQLFGFYILFHSWKGFFLEKGAKCFTCVYATAAEIRFKVWLWWCDELKPGFICDKWLCMLT